MIWKGECQGRRTEWQADGKLSHSTVVEKNAANFLSG